MKYHAIFGCSVRNMIFGLPPHTFQESKISLLIKNLETTDTEWMLNPTYLSTALRKLQISPHVDLFASRLNIKQFDIYVSYKPDPYAKHFDAFAISWTNGNLYCFPPFCCILKSIRKILQDKAKGILVVPDWPIQRAGIPYCFRFLFNRHNVYYRKQTS